MTFLTISIVVLLLVNAVSLYLLFNIRKSDNRGPHAGDGKGPAEYIVKQLKLDQQQQEQFEELRNQHQGIVHREEHEDHRLHDLYFSLLKTDNPDKRQTDSLAALIGEQRKKLAVATFDHFTQLRAICRDDQKKLFDETIDEVVRMMGSHPPGGPPPPPEK